MLIGGHFPIADGFDAAVENAVTAGANTIQIFTKSPTVWSASEIDNEKAESFINIAKKEKIAPIVVHASYLINLASAKPESLNRAIGVFVDEIKRADKIKAKYIVIHCGSYKDTTEEIGIATFSESLAKCLEKTEGIDVDILLETTAGQGAQLGAKFEHIQAFINNCGNHKRLGVCFDTCHSFSAGYDISQKEGYLETFDEFDRTIGLKNLKVIHLNDSKNPLGSRKDRHEYIGEGFIGLKAFEMIVNDKNFENVPLILETPQPNIMHKKQIEMLRSLKK